MNDSPNGKPANGDGNGKLAYLLTLRALMETPPPAIRGAHTLLAHLLARADRVFLSNGDSLRVGDMELCSALHISHDTVSRHRKKLVSAGYLTATVGKGAETTEYQMWTTCRKLSEDYAEMRRPPTQGCVDPLRRDAYTPYAEMRRPPTQGCVDLPPAEPVVERFYNAPPLQIPPDPFRIPPENLTGELSARVRARDFLPEKDPRPDQSPDPDQNPVPSPLEIGPPREATDVPEPALVLILPPPPSSPVPPETSVSAIPPSIEPENDYRTQPGRAPLTTGALVMRAAFSHLEDLRETNRDWDAMDISPLDREWMANRIAEIDAITPPVSDVESLMVEMHAEIDLAFKSSFGHLQSLRGAKNQIRAVIAQKRALAAGFVKPVVAFEDAVPRSSLVTQVDDALLPLMRAKSPEVKHVARVLAPLDFLPDDERILHYAAMQCVKQWWCEGDWKGVADLLRKAILRVRSPAVESPTSHEEEVQVATDEEIAVVERDILGPLKERWRAAGIVPRMHPSLVEKEDAMIGAVGAVDLVERRFEPPGTERIDRMELEALSVEELVERLLRGGPELSELASVAHRLSREQLIHYLVSVRSGGNNPSAEAWGLESS